MKKNVRTLGICKPSKKKMKLTFTNWNISKNFFILGRRMRKFSLHLQSDCSLAGQHTGATTKSRTRNQYMVMAVETGEAWSVSEWGNLE